jgi:flagellar biosynthesis/type III secretory pathway protein FliH
MTFERVKVETGDTSVLTTPAKVSSFAVRPETWEALFADPTLRADFERRVEEAVVSRLEPDLQKYRAQVEAEAREAGVARGMEEAAQLLTQGRAELSAVCHQVLASQEAVLRAHERAWAEALVRLLRRFLVPHGDQIASGIRDWLNESLTGFAGRHAMRIRLAPDQAQQVRRALGESNGSGWELVKDESLAPGEIRCESEAGGLIFNASPEAEQLDKFLAEYFPEETA